MQTRLISILAMLMLAASSSMALATDLHDEGVAAFNNFIRAVGRGPDAVAGVLAPEFQIQRSDGSGYDRQAYIDDGLSRVSLKSAWSLEDMVVTGDDEILVVRGTLVITADVEGKPIDRRAPRLTVFRKIDGAWKVLAHANYAAKR